MDAQSTHTLTHTYSHILTHTHTHSHTHTLTHTHTQYQRIIVYPTVIKQPLAFSLLQVKITYVSLSLSLYFCLSYPLSLALHSSPQGELLNRSDEEEGIRMKAGGGPEGNGNVDDDEKEEAATGKPLYSLVLAFTDKYPRIFTRRHTQLCTNIPWAPWIMCSCV